MSTETYFTNKVIQYERFRPQYPTSFFGFFPQDSGLNVADIGAGTGYVSIPLARKNFNVMAIEPNVEMRGALHTKISDLTVQIIDANAYQTGLEAQSVDYITLGNVAHWLDRKPKKLAACRAEFQRILKPSGEITVLAVSPSMRNGWISDVFNMVKLHDPEFGIEKITRTFAEPEFHASNFISDIDGVAHEQSTVRMTQNDFLDFIFSHSFCTHAMFRELRAIYDNHKTDEGIDVQFDSSIHIGEPRFN